ncbi:MAG: 50S ribosomal protein L2 [Candidatus Aureabacteria bacterium]|nr:50S ribosomal protein L2 [Candidatus Auribacterota bacterium]
MTVKTFKAKTPSQRFKSISDYSQISKSGPEKSLVVSKKRTSGRNALGRVTMRRRGGGHKRKLRIIDFKRDKHDIPAKVAHIEYDPNRSARIALLKYADGEKRYILCPEDLKVGSMVLSGENVEVTPGNTMPIKNIPLGLDIHNIEMKKGRGGQLVRSAGSSAQLMAKEGEKAHIRMPSGEIRTVSVFCMATIGKVGNSEHESIKLGKAGRTRWLGRRPKVRGVAMNPIDHPLGGGEGKSSGGRHPCTPWGKPTKGYKTRKKNKPTDHIVKPRSKK